MSEPAGGRHRHYVRVVNWTIFQHYKDRNPIWIKFYGTVLEDPAIAVLPDARKAHVFGIWLLASRLDNRIPADPDFIGKRINATTPVDVKTLMTLGFLEPVEECAPHASELLASCYTTLKVAYTEKEQSRERTEQRREELAPANEAGADRQPAAPATESLAKPQPPAWNGEFAEDWKAAYGGTPTEGCFSAVRRGARTWTWERVRPVLKFYLAESPSEYVNLPKFFAAFPSWEKRAGGAPARASPRASVGDRAMASAAAFLRTKGGCGDQGG